MIKVKQLKLRIFAQFVIIIAPIALVLIYQAVSDLRRTTAVESVVVRHGLSRATKDGFESFMTYAADAVDMGSLGQRAYEALQQSVASAAALRRKDPGAAAVAASLGALAGQISVAMPLERLLALQPQIRGCSASSRSRDRKSTRLNSSHLVISYAVFCLKKKNKNLYTLSPLNQYNVHAVVFITQASLLAHLRITDSTTTLTYIHSTICYIDILYLSTVFI